MVARILLIEDNPANLELMTYLLGAHGYATLAATDGAEGVAVAHREIPDLVVCDVQMPTVDGLEVARRLKSDPACRAIPLVAVTAYAMVGDRDRVLAAGFDGYIAKPINPETFVRQLETFLQLDQYAAAPPPRARSDAVPQALPTGPAILVVDNLPDNLDLARSILQPHGYRVSTAEGIAAALALARQCSFDLILSDVCMNGESGYDFIQAVKALPSLRAIPFVFITSTMLEPKDRARGLALGADAFLTRPIEPVVLLREIGTCLRGSRKD